MRRTAIALGVAPVAAVLVAGCGASSPAGSSTSPAATMAASVPPVPGMTAEAVRLRTDEVLGGQVQVRIAATAEFTVTGVALDSPGFESLPVRAVTAAFTPGRIIDLPTPYGGPVCDAEPEPATALLSVAWPDGRVEDVRVPLAAEILTRIHDEECAVLALAEVVDVAVTGLRDEGDVLAGELTVTRRSGDESVVVARLDRSVLVEPSAELPVELADGRRVVSTPVTFAPATCEPHVLAETKKPYVFPLAVVVGKQEAVVLYLPLDEVARGLLDALVQRVCAVA